jgi:hypothetical protein
MFFQKNAVEIGTYFGARRFITGFTTSQHSSLAGPCWIPAILCWNVRSNIYLFMSGSYARVIFIQLSPPQPCTHLIFTPYVLHALLISFYLISSPEWYLVRNADDKAPPYIVFSTLLSPRPSLTQTSPSAHCFRKPSAKITPLLPCFSISLADGTPECYRSYWGTPTCPQ